MMPLYGVIATCLMLFCLLLPSAVYYSAGLERTLFLGLLISCSVLGSFVFYQMFEMEGVWQSENRLGQLGAVITMASYGVMPRVIYRMLQQKAIREFERLLSDHPPR